MRIGELGDDHRRPPCRAAPDQLRALSRLPRQHEHALLGQQVGEAAARVERERPAVPVEGQAALDPGADLVAQRHKVADRAEMDVGRVVPMVVQQLRFRHLGRETTGRGGCARSRNWGTTRSPACRSATALRARAAAGASPARSGSARRRRTHPSGKASRSLSASPWITDRPWPHAGVDPGLAELDAARVDALLARQIGEQRAVAAADVEHPRARLDHVGDQPQVAAQLVRRGRRPAGGAATPRGSAALRLMPRSRSAAGRGARRSRSESRASVANSSGSCSRKASWPLSVSISTKLTLAATAFSACTRARLSEVGNSQSLVKEMMQKRGCVPREGGRQ